MHHLGVGLQVGLEPEALLGAEKSCQDEEPSGIAEWLPNAAHRFHLQISTVGPRRMVFNSTVTSTLFPDDEGMITACSLSR